MILGLKWERMYIAICEFPCFQQPSCEGKFYHFGGGGEDLESKVEGQLYTGELNALCHDSVCVCGVVAVVFWVFLQMFIVCLFCCSSVKRKATG